MKRKVAGRGGRENGKAEAMAGRVTGAIVTTLIFAAFLITIWVKEVQYNRNCGGHLKRAADANTVDIAETELQMAVGYLKMKGMTTGYTSILYNTPSEDVGFWYNNLNASLRELDHLPATASPLERSNMLMKLRETLLDHGAHGDGVTEPDGITVYPNNLAYAFWGWASLIAAIVFWISVCWD
jgi:hypothetical protein